MLYLLLIVVSPVWAQQIGINTTTVHSSAVLQVESTTRGFLIPRLTTTARLAINTSTPAPATGLLVFDIDTNTFWYYNSTEWIELKDTYKNEDIGVIAAFHGTPPAGWLALNGSSVAASTYPGLASKQPGWVSGANIVLPDYRGYFLRGNGSNSDGLATGPAPGVKQGQATDRPSVAMVLSSAGGHTHTASFDTEPNHTHTYFDANAGNAWHPSTGGSIAGATRSWSNVNRTTGNSGAHTHNFNAVTGGAHTHSITGGGDAETKPSNITVTWAIKAR